MFRFLSVLKQTFDSFDVEKKGCIPVDMIGQILDMLGYQQTADELQVTCIKINKQLNVFFF